MKKAELIFGAILLPVDYLMLVLAGFSAYALRFQSSFQQLRPVIYTVPFKQFAAIVFITAFVWLIFFAFAGLYHIRGTRRITSEVRKIVLACSTGVLAIVILFFFQRDLFSSRFIILAAYLFAICYVTIARIAILFFERYLFQRGFGVHNVALVGMGRLTTMVAHEITQNKALGFHVKFQTEHFSVAAQDRLARYAADGQIDELIQTNPDISRDENQKMYEFCDEHHLVFKYAAALFDTQSSNIVIQPIAGIPIVEVQRTPLDGWGRILKRACDILGSIFFILCTSPLMIGAAIAIRIWSPGSIFFARRDDGTSVKRVGQFGRPFLYFKFRTMRPNTDSLRYNEALLDQNVRKGSPLVKIVNDPRVTSVGKFLRRMSIDELPELFLVLKGDMSLVGPRPHLPEEVAQYQKHHKRVLNMKPGMTGLAQISGRSDLAFEDEIRLDTFYMENWSLWLDLLILLKTPFVLLKRRKAL